MLEKIRQEWAVIRGAPWSIAVLAAVFVTSGFGASTALYKVQVDTAHEALALAKEQAEASRKAAPGPKEHSDAPSSPGPASSAPATIGVRGAITPSYVAELRKSHTDAEVRRLLSVAVGSPARITGVVRNASQMDAKYFVYPDDLPVALIFEGPSVGPASILHKGDSFAASCHFDEATATAITYRSCNLAR